MDKTVKTWLLRCLPQRLLLAKGRGSRPDVALTFDDGPHPHYTEQILKILRHEGVRATFFLIGSEVAKYPELANAIAKEGHAIGNHSFSHRRFTGMRQRALADELERAATLIGQATGVSVRLIRPPHGAVTMPLLSYAARRRWTIVLWSLDSRDSWKTIGEAGMREAIRGACPGDIVLLHEDYPHTVEALPRIIQDLKAKRLTFATVDALIGSGRSR
ncbi:MAG: polysaccharide deacetylase family protein [Candidatus Omnitrophica bacterium]|nr:polysaccharide deacetylase family protein [Candidatus Omnitrophota bacterium]